MTFETLARAWREARKPYQRTHVTPYIYENPEHFTILSKIGDVVKVESDEPDPELGHIEVPLPLVIR